MMTIDQIKAELTARGIARKDFCEMAGISQGSLSMYFNGKATPGIKTLENMEAALHGKPSVKKASEIVPRYSPHCVAQAAKALSVDVRLIRKGLRNGTYSWGTCLDPNAIKKIYLIDRQEFYKQFGVILEAY